MNFPEQYCIKLFSTISPCPLIKKIPKYMRLVSKVSHELDHPSFQLPNEFIDILDYCHLCTRYVPVDTYWRGD